MEGQTMQLSKEKGQKDKHVHKPHITPGAYLGAPEG